MIRSLELWVWALGVCPSEWSGPTWTGPQARASRMPQAPSSWNPNPAFPLSQAARLLHWGFEGL